MRDISAIKIEFIKTLVNNLNFNSEFQERFTTDENIFSKLEHFIKLKEEVNINQIHTSISAELNLRYLSLQYNDVLLYSEINIYTYSENTIRNIAIKVCMKYISYVYRHKIYLI